MFPDDIKESLLNSLKSIVDKKITWVGAERLSGGSVNNTWRIITSAGNFFVKYNNSYTFPEIFEAEARGLIKLQNAGALRVPEILDHQDLGEHCYLMLQYMTEEHSNTPFFEDFGRNLAKLHKNSWKAFGLDHSNYIGSIRQSNAPRGDWAPFFIEERIQPLVKDAVDNSLLSSRVISKFEKVFRKLDDLFPKEQPALLHGDLWEGNYIRLGNGEAVLIDPAVYYGHREVDLAMTRMFSGFDNSFYAAYHEEFPLEPGWEERIYLWNIYPLLVHVKLFGQDYVNKLMSHVERFL